MLRFGMPPLLFLLCSSEFASKSELLSYGQGYARLPLVFSIPIPVRYLA